MNVPTLSSCLDDTDARFFRHGISAATGAAFEGPQATRKDDKGGWEGRCEDCGKWIALVASKRGGVPWFRHAYKVRIYVLENYRFCGV